MQRVVKNSILVILVLSSLILEVTGISLKLGSNYSYYIKPLLWSFIGIIAFVLFKGDVVPNHKYKKEVQFYVLITSLMYFFIYFIFGYANGFANNPYDHSIKGILSNLWTFMPVLIAKEYIRFYLVNHSSKKRILLYTLLISFLLTLTELNIYKFGDYLSDSYTFLRFVMEIFLPTFMISLYLTYISYFAGYGITIIYSLLPQLAIYVFPILPNVNWMLLAILNSGVPFFSYVYINYQINRMDKTIDKREYKTVGLKGWLSMILMVALIVAFGLGVFPIEPLVIASDSMYPKIRKGDIVIIFDIDPDDIQVGDVIRYKMENYYVVHRVKEIHDVEDNKREFILLGDNNKNIDLYPVREDQIKGIIRAKVPYAGWPTLILSDLLNTNVADSVKVETGAK